MTRDQLINTAKTIGNFLPPIQAAKGLGKGLSGAYTGVTEAIPANIKGLQYVLQGKSPQEIAEQDRIATLATNSAIEDMTKGGIQFGTNLIGVGTKPANLIQALAGR